MENGMKRANGDERRKHRPRGQLANVPRKKGQRSAQRRSVGSTAAAAAAVAHIGRRTGAGGEPRQQQATPTGRA